MAVDSWFTCDAVFDVGYRVVFVYLAMCHGDWVLCHWGGVRPVHNVTDGYIKFNVASWFQTFAVFWMLYSLHWVIPLRLNFTCRRFDSPCQFRLHRRCKQEEYDLYSLWDLTNSVYMHCILSFKYHVFKASIRSVLPKHVACVNGRDTVCCGSLQYV